MHIFSTFWEMKIPRGSCLPRFGRHAIRFHGRWASVSQLDTDMVKAEACLDKQLLLAGEWWLLQVWREGIPRLLHSSP